MKLKILLMTFESNDDFKEDAGCLRGFFASKFNEFVELHNHITDKYVYSYPLIQYKMFDQRPLIVGINNGVDILKEILDQFEIITLNDTDYEITERSMTIRKEDFCLTKKIHFYEFITPWAALNQKNHERYMLIKNEESRAALLRKILTGNLLSMSKTFGYTVPDTIKCDIDLMSREMKFKGRDFISFCGGFMVNFCIPDYLGIGRSVSKGHGTVRKWYGPPDMY